MALTIFFTRKSIVTIHPLTWYVLPSKVVLGNTWTNYNWLCFTLDVQTSKSVEKNKDWSDDEVVRQMKALEKEVEGTKSKPKSAIKRKQ